MGMLTYSSLRAALDDCHQIYIHPLDHTGTAQSNVLPSPISYLASFCYPEVRPYRTYGMVATGCLPQFDFSFFVCKVRFSRGPDGGEVLTGGEGQGTGR